MTRPIVYLVEVPTPYRNAEMDRAAAGLGTDAIRTIFIRPDKDGCFEYDLPQLCPFRVLNGRADQQGIAFDDVTDWLAAERPALVIVGGYSQPIARRVLSWCVKTGTRFALRSDSNLWSDRLKGNLKFLVRRWRLGHWVRRAHKIMLTGTYNRDFWNRYGMHDQQAGWWPQWINYDHYGSAVALREREHESLRQRFGLVAPVQLVHVGRLIPRKRVDLICEALLASDHRAGLCIAGGGPEEASLRARYGSRLGERLQFLGSVHQRDVPALYAASDVLAVASGASEPWGMVLNEGTIAGLPVICDHRVGAAGDLVRDGVNGLALRENDVPSWTAAINRLTENAALREKMRGESVRIARDWQQRSEPAECLRPYLDKG